MKTDTRDLLARFSEALRPLGMPDSLDLALEERRECSSASQLDELAWSVARFTTAALATVVIHLAALKYIFWLG